MNGTKSKSIELLLAYHTGVDDPERGVFSTRPVDPEFTNELRLGVYTDDPDTNGFPAALSGKRLQVQLAGTPRALEALGSYLIALALLNTPDPDPHEHFEDVRDERGGDVHLIVRRTPRL